MVQSVMPRNFLVAVTKKKAFQVARGVRAVASKLSGDDIASDPGSRSFFSLCRHTHMHTLSHMHTHTHAHTSGVLYL